MTSDFKLLYSKLETYYNELENALLLTDNEKDIVVCSSLVEEMYIKAKHIKEASGKFDRSTSVDFMRILDLSHDHELFRSIPNPREYDKEYSAEEIANDDDLNEIKSLSISDIEKKIIDNRTIIVCCELYHPLKRAMNVILDFRKDKYIIEDCLHSCLNGALERDDLDKDILFEIIQCELGELIKDDKLSEEITSLLYNLFECLEESSYDRITFLHFALFVWVLDYFGCGRFGVRLTKKERDILRGPLNSILLFLKELYGSDSSALMEFVTNNPSELNEHYSKIIQNCPSFKWINNSGLVSAKDDICDGDEFRLPEDFCEKQVYKVDTSEYFKSLEIPITEQNKTHFVEMIKYFADEGYIENKKSIKEALVYRLTGKYRPEREIPVIHWYEKHDEEQKGLTLYYLVCYGYQKGVRGNYDRMKKFFDGPHWLENDKIPGRASHAAISFRRKLHSLYPDIFKLNMGEPEK